MKKIRLILIIFVFGIRVYAGDATGHGGDGIRCANASGESFETLDKFEGRVYRHLIFDMGNEADEPKIQVATALRHLEPLDSDRYRRYYSWLESFDSEMAYLINYKLNPIADWGYLPIPGNCKVEQVVWQVVPQVSTDTRYWVDRARWESLSKRDQALMILHELCYRDALERGQEDSSSARYWNELIASTHFESLSPQSYLAALVETKYDRHMYLFQIQKEKFSLNYFSSARMTYQDGVSFCQKKGMGIPSSNSMTSTFIDTPILSSSLYRYVRGPEYPGTNQFWIRTLFGFGVFSLEDRVSVSGSTSDITYEVMCIAHEG
jgi:hypothetical protein